MLPRTVMAIAAAWIMASAARAQTVPEPIKARVNEMVAACLAAGGRFAPPPGPNRFAVPRDFNGDGRTDFLVAEGGFPCAGQPTLFRPGNLARLQLWLGDGLGGARLVFDERVSGHRISDGRPAVVHIARLGAVCGAGVARCEDRLSLTAAGSVALVPVDGRPGGPVPHAPPAAPGAVAEPATRAAGPLPPALPLRRGYFVDANTPCNRASNATVLLHTGEGLNGSRSICTFRTVEPLGAGRFRVVQACRELAGFGREDAPEISTLTFEIPDAGRFTIRWPDGSSASNRHCPQAVMNKPFRSNDLRDLLR